jgi:hypothetical protein
MFEPPCIYMCFKFSQRVSATSLQVNQQNALSSFLNFYVTPQHRKVKYFGSLVERVYYHWFIVMHFVCGVTVEYVVSLLFALCLCSLLCSNYSFYIFIIRFMFVFLFCMFCFLFCVFCVFVLFCILLLLVYIVVSFLFLYKFTDHCHRVETQLQLINITSYHTVFQPTKVSSSGNTNQTILHKKSIFVHTVNMFWILQR